VRHAFGTRLSKASVAPRTAQAPVRHGSVELTMNVYTDARLLDVDEAINTLPTLDAATTASRQTAGVVM